MILVEENHDLPLVRVQLTLRIGAADDDAGDDGLTNFATELMGRGAGGRTRAEIDAAFDALGTGLDVSSDYDGVTFDVAVLKEKLEPALALLADVLLRPDFPRDEADKLKRELLAQLDELRDDDGSLVRRFFSARSMARIRTGAPSSAPRRRSSGCRSTARAPGTARRSAARTSSSASPATSTATTRRRRSRASLRRCRRAAAASRRRGRTWRGGPACG